MRRVDGVGDVRPWPGDAPGVAWAGLGPPAVLALLTLAGLALRLFRIDSASYWSDELFSVFWVRNSASFLWSAEAFEIETTPPLYYALLKPWVAAFGESEFAVRSLSALVSAAGIPLVWRLAREFMPGRVALLAAALFALMPMQVHYAQEARAYALLPPLYVLTLLGLLGFLRRAPAPAWGALLGYGLAALALVYSHATSAFTLAALNLCAMAWLVWRRAGLASLLRLGLASLAVVLLSAPEIRAILAQATRYDLAWIGRPDLLGLINLMNVLVIDPFPSVHFRVITLSSLAVLGLLAWRLWSRPPAAAVWLLLAGPAVLFLAMTLGLSWLSSPFFIPRIAVWLQVPLAILLAWALLGRGAWLPRLGLALAIAWAFGFGLSAVLYGTVQQKEDWRGLAAFMEPQLGAGDVVVLGPRTNLLGLAHYLGPDLPQARWTPAGAPPMPLASALWNPVAEPVRLSDADIAEALRQGRRVWLVLNPQDSADFLRQAGALLPGTTPRLDRSHPMLTLLTWGRPS